MYSRKPTQGKEGNAMFSIACLFAVQFVSFLEGRGIGAVPFPFPGIIVGIFCGLLCGGLLFSTRLGKQYASLWLLSLTAVSVLLWGNVLRNNDALSCYGACMLGAAVLPPVLARLLAASRSPGLHVGIAFAIGDFFWLFLYLLPAPPSAKFLQGILLVLQSVGGGLAAFDLWKANRAVPPVPEPELTHQGYRRYESLGYLTAITLVFFILNAFIDIPFYRMHDAAFPIPAQVHLFIWIVYPLTGLFIDKRGADMRLLLVCLGGNILPRRSSPLRKEPFCTGSSIPWCWQAGARPCCTYCSSSPESTDSFSIGNSSSSFPTWRCSPRSWAPPYSWSIFRGRSTSFCGASFSPPRSAISARASNTP